LRTAAAAETVSSHPLARAVVALAHSRGLDLPAAGEVEEVGGHGVSCRVDQGAVLTGSGKLLADALVPVGDCDPRLDELAGEGKSTVLVAVDGQVAGIIAMADTLKEGAAEAIVRLGRLGLQTVMISGDRRPAALAVAGQLGIDAVEAEVLPGDKQAVVRSYQQGGRLVGMVGDGINDAPALAQADIGIAIGSGTDVAKETGEIILVRDDVRDVVRSIELGRMTLAKIKQNLFWAFIYNVIGIPVAAGLLYPAFDLVLKPEFAGLAMAFSSVSVVANSLLLKRSAARIR
jgi:Cu+-exporting ATPase